MQHSTSDIYDYYKKVKIRGFRFYGAPGTTLREHSNQDAGDECQQWIRGRIGEKLFMSMASAKGLLNRCVSFWSLKVNEEWDLDCALLFADLLVLVDVKSRVAQQHVFFKWYQGASLQRVL